MKPPETRYARSGDVRIAYQVIGNGPIDLVFVPGFLSNLEVHWEDPGYSHLLQRLGAFTRLIQFDKRGTGLSDRVDNRDLPDLETRMDDVRAVMDAAGSGRAALLGASEGAPMSILFAATYPERSRALVLYGGYAHFHSAVMGNRRVTRCIRARQGRRCALQGMVGPLRTPVGQSIRGDRSRANECPDRCSSCACEHSGPDACDPSDYRRPGKVCGGTPARPKNCRGALRRDARPGSPDLDRRYRRRSRQDRRVSHRGTSHP